ncbi:conserved oligomeric Golgi complex subunit 2 [Toxorhynchites rutilus septentrionalis]|uniref:conserved oligomeric Golgi complex subunit 2 n=1 Tax=Toxorhynchites rutilus septentrionalis TaxID=329112 RepID=UPI0024797478|nr:conserved oligomeric Golgi complex subunit 2 [Toxorhynchites rutilus septentrionalis]
MANTRDLFSLPAGPADLCFDKNEFMKKTFSVDEFLHENRNAGSLEIIRDDLGIYLKVLRSAMIELINQDYADFVDLSANLIGLDQQISGIGAPLEKLREEVLTMREALQGTMKSISDCLDQKKALRTYKKSLQSLGKVQQALVKLDNLLSPMDGREHDINPILLERAALESIQLQFNIKFCGEFLNEEQMRRSESMKNNLLMQMKEYFLKTLEQKNIDGMERCLRIYCTLDETRTAEEVFKHEIVSPYMNRVVSESSLQNSPQGLTGIYNQILDFISLNMKSLLTLTKKNGKVKGFNFIINSFWTEVERRMETNMSSIFAPGNPESFYQKYKCTLEFLERIEQIIEDSAEIAYFKAHPQYKSFQVRWNLPVYFQIRFQEIGSNLEKACSREIDAIRFTSQQIGASQFNLITFSIALTCISNCWQEGIYLPQLFHRFVKFTLQLLSRATTWIDTAITFNPPLQTDSPEPLLRLKLLATLFSDVTNLSKKIPNIITLIIQKAPPVLALTAQKLDELFFDNRSALSAKLNRLQTLIVQELVQISIPHIKQVSDIPRLYRKTNREVPSKCCPYMEQLIQPSRNFQERYSAMVGDEQLKEFLGNVYRSLTLHYYQAVDEVLISVQKTEESLRRLKNLRDRNANPITTATFPNSGSISTDRTSMSDDDKIRLQIQVDVIYYVQEIERLGLARGEIEKLHELVLLTEKATKIKIGNNQQTPEQV